MFDFPKISLTEIVATGGSLVLATTAGALEERPAVPSGFEVTLQETRTETLQDGTAVLRLRFVMPQIGGDSASYVTVADDFASLCETVGMSTLAETGLAVDQIVVSLSDRETAFGVANPDATQYFEVFTLENDTCIWEAF
ncbi:DUF6497 family protein [Cognatishimia maritima]|uniref:Acetolactate synthase n=1 Tax=Cognatishimia maritima TaxID=870908 RepID=A0A1M5JSZ1_9RHOB|nr:DUF6497 family protein [Cognatishimia maritima]SHG43389.1 hypothetical protein SAMN04488044_0768 [Cognatishimia maritima]